MSVRGYVTRLRRRDRRAGLALLHRARAIRRTASKTRPRSGSRRPGPGEWWKNGKGGGTAWDSFAFDPELEPALHRRRQRGELEPQDPQSGGRRQPLRLLDRRRRRGHRRLPLALPDDPGRPLGLHRDAAHDPRRARDGRGTALQQLPTPTPVDAPGYDEMKK